MAKYALVLVIALSLFVSACGPRMVGATDTSVTFEGVDTEWLTSNLDDATKQAVAHCGQYNKSAQLQTVDKGNAIFHCVPRQP